MNFLFRFCFCGLMLFFIMRMILFGLYLFLMWQLGRCFISFLVKVFIFLCFGMLFIVSLFFEKFMNMQVLVLMNIGLVSFMSLVQFFGLCMFFFFDEGQFYYSFCLGVVYKFEEFFYFFLVVGDYGDVDVVVGFKVWGGK